MKNPNWSVTVELDCTRVYLAAKRTRTSFFLLCLHASLKAANEVEAFRYRISDIDQVVIHDVVNASTTVDRANGTFGFGYIDYAESFAEFEEQGRVELENVRNGTGLVDSNGRNNLIYYSALPWLNFSSLTHASNGDERNGIPKITFGKLLEEKKKRVMPVSIQVNHALVDGLHVGKFVQRFQEILDDA